MKGYTSRQMIDKAEMLVNGAVSGTTDGSDGVCVGCHVDYTGGGTSLNCTNGWRKHVTQGRVAESVFVQVSEGITGTTCGW
jgi:hypothetical protein